MGPTNKTYKMTSFFTLNNGFHVANVCVLVENQRMSQLENQLT